MYSFPSSPNPKVGAITCLNFWIDSIKLAATRASVEIGGETETRLRKGFAKSFPEEMI